MKKADLFETMITELTMNFTDSDESLLEGTKEYPLPGRLKILAEGFAAGYDLDEVNETLRDEGYETLYARSLYEAGLIYAFSHKTGYESWRALYQSYMEKRCV